MSRLNVANFRHPDATADSVVITSGGDTQIQRALGLGGATYGTSGQVLTSQGSGSAPQWATPAGGKILQVVQTAFTSNSTYTTSGTTQYNIISVSITPSATSSKILILADIKGDAGANYNALSYKLKRGTTDIYIADSSGSAGRASFGGFEPGSQGYQQNSFVSHFLDSPSTTSSITYAVAVWDPNADGGTFYFNRNRNSNTTGNDSNSASSITVMEVGA